MIPRRALCKAPLRRWVRSAASAASEQDKPVAWHWQQKQQQVHAPLWFERRPAVPACFVQTAPVWTSAQQEHEGEGDDKLDPASEGTGWSRKELLSWPNTISLSRLVLGPFLGWAVVEGYPGIAFCGMVVGGATDWLDGYVARRMGIKSVLGSYLDPLADKVLVGSVALSMAYTGLLHPALVGLMVSRDATLVLGATLFRARSLGWKWTGWGEFFRINAGGAPKIQPIFISKVNTVLQVALICGALLEPVFPGTSLDTAVWYLSWSAGATTVGSWLCYGALYYRRPGTLGTTLPRPKQD